MIRQYELVEKVKDYDPNADEDALNRAYVFSMKAHGSQKRASGDPFFSHPLEVANILAEMKLDSTTIITALLHDTVEDTVATLEEIERLFGKDVKRLVDGVTKLSKIELQSAESRQAENFRKLILAMSYDIRVLLIKLADRLHNMRTLCYVPLKEKRQRTAKETMEIYVPLAERIGINHIKNELEDLAFAELTPDARESIRARLEFLKDEGENDIDFVLKGLRDLFEKHDLAVKVSGRQKTPYSIWRKMRHKNISFDQLSDIMAFRVLVGSVADCYQVLGLCHSSFPVIPGRFKDYISTPKPNGYQSLHTTVFGPRRQRIEIQIRTQEMHEVNKFGVAAHWKYKQGIPSKDGAAYQWLRGILDILDQTHNAEEFLEHTKLEMYQDQVFCFTPMGDLISLPKGATPIDFAYAVHSDVGNNCVAAKINGRMVALRTILQNGDQIEITTSKAQTPAPTWERFAVTGKARAAIRRFLRTQKRTQYVDLGRMILFKTARQEKFSLGDKLLHSALQHFHCHSLEDLYALVGEGLKTAHDVLRFLYPEHTLKQEKPLLSIHAAKVKDHEKNEFTSVSVKGLIPGMAIHYANCCHPLPGDKIIGIVVTGKGVSIHTHDCENLERYADDPERWLDISWNEEAEMIEKHTGRLQVMLVNEIGSLATLTTLIGKSGGNISNFRVLQKHGASFEVLIDIDVNSREHLDTIINTLRASPSIDTVERSRG